MARPQLLSLRASVCSFLKKHAATRLASTRQSKHAAGGVEGAGTRRRRQGGGARRHSGILSSHLAPPDRPCTHLQLWDWSSYVNNKVHGWGVHPKGCCARRYPCALSDARCVWTGWILPHAPPSSAHAPGQEGSCPLPLHPRPLHSPFPPPPQPRHRGASSASPRLSSTPASGIGMTAAGSRTRSPALASTSGMAHRCDRMND